MATLSEAPEFEREDTVVLSIGAMCHTRWKEYRIDSDMLTPADAWDVSLGGLGANPLPEGVAIGQDVKISIRDEQGREELILSGQIDSVSDRTDKQSGRSVRIDGRDEGARLIDNASELLTLNNASISTIIEKAVKPLGVTKIKWATKTAAQLKEKAQVEPGQNVWDWLKPACEANKVWPHFEPDGTLVIGQPDYTSPVVDKLILSDEPGKTNVLSMERKRTQIEQFEEVLVYGQGSGRGGKGSNIKGSATNKDFKASGYKRRKVVVDGNITTASQAKARAEKIMADGRMEGDRITVEVRGHRNAQGDLWKPGMRVELESPEREVSGVWYLLGRAFTLGMSGKRTELRFIPDGAWILDSSVKTTKRSAKAKSKTKPANKYRQKK